MECIISLQFVTVLFLAVMESAILNIVIYNKAKQSLNKIIVLHGCVFAYVCDIMMHEFILKK